jgi:OH-DDVA oxygenase/3-O-methylgallate 3,4-dioxygenase
MAKIILGIYTTHGPQLNTTPKQWLLRVPADKQRMHWYKGKQYSFDEMVELRKADNLAEESSAAIRQQRWEACQRGVESLATTWNDVKPDVAVIFGNDQRECFHEDITPMFTIYGGEKIRQVPLTEEQEKKLPPGILETEWAYRPEDPVEWPGLPDLAQLAMEEGHRSRFDLSWSLEWPEKAGAWHRGTPHSFSWIFRRIMNDKVVPTLPLVTNTFFPPNQPTAERCFEFGEMIGRAIASWDSDLTVGIFGSGGMSHFVIDSEIDQLVFDALRDRDRHRLCSIPQNLLMSGTSELRNWISAAGALFQTGLSGDAIDYQTCYRSEAGTGTAQGFVAWQ